QDLHSPLAAPKAPSSPSEEFPADWSIKTRVLFTSSQPFTWAEQLKAQEEAQGFARHCRAAEAALPRGVQEPRLCQELRCAFQQSLVYWLHPWLPWLPLFPRLGADRSMAGRACPWAQDEALQQVLISDWFVCKAKSLLPIHPSVEPFPLFLLSLSVTLLSAAPRVVWRRDPRAGHGPGRASHRALSSAPGIEFSMPLLEESRSGKRNSEESLGRADGLGGARGAEDAGEPAPSDEEDDDGNFSWLEEMGVQDEVKKPDSVSIQLRKEKHEVQLDHRAESLVLVRGSNTFRLLNFLISCRSLVAAAGPQAGLPPTLLSPVAFRGGTMQTLKVRHGRPREGQGVPAPTSRLGAISLSAAAGLGRLRPLWHPGAGHPGQGLPGLSACGCPWQEGAQPELPACGLHPRTLEQLRQCPTLGKSSLRVLEMRDYSYTWKA
ncbi:DONS protein, partial [Regulus satrapa]|nr:DONS protein [Regulus satrapa]